MSKQASSNMRDIKDIKDNDSYDTVCSILSKSLCNTRLTSMTRSDFRQTLDNWMRSASMRGCEFVEYFSDIDLDYDDYVSDTEQILSNAIDMSGSLYKPFFSEDITSRYTKKFLDSVENGVNEYLAEFRVDPEYWHSVDMRTIVTGMLIKMCEYKAGSYDEFAELTDFVCNYLSLRLHAMYTKRAD